MPSTDPLGRKKGGHGQGGNPLAKWQRRMINLCTTDLELVDFTTRPEPSQHQRPRAIDLERLVSNRPDASEIRLGEI